MTRVIRKRSTLAARVFPRLMLAALAAGALLVSARATHAGSPEEVCQKGRYSAGAKYSACQQKVLAKLFAGGEYHTFVSAATKCRVKYTAVWPKLQAKAPGSSCDTARFTDNGTTVTDNLTGLQWEKKTDDATIHDKDNLYAWSAAPPFEAADGTAFATFLPTLNSGCFAGQCDWRLPTLYELQTILSEAFPCTASPCLDPIFGPTVASGYWSATTYATNPNLTFDVSFDDGFVDDENKDNLGYVRAVRGGL